MLTYRLSARSCETPKPNRYPAATRSPALLQYDYYIDPAWIQGSIPDDITGTLFFSGPGLTTLYGTTVRNPDDADGMVSTRVRCALCVVHRTCVRGT